MPVAPRADHDLAPDRVIALTGDSGPVPGQDYRFPRDGRLTNSRAFARVRRNNLNGRSRLFRYSVVANRYGRPRLGITVSRRVSGLAVQRNRIKRQIREYFRHKRGELGAYDLVLSGIPGAVDNSNKEIQRDLGRLWRQLEKRLPQS